MKKLVKQADKWVNDNPEFGDPVVFDSWEEIEEAADHFRAIGYDAEKFLMGVVPLEEYESGFDEEGVHPNAKERWQKQYK